MAWACWVRVVYALVLMSLGLCGTVNGGHGVGHLGMKKQLMYSHLLGHRLGWRIGG